MKKLLSTLSLFCVVFVHMHASIETVFPAYPKLLQEKTWDKAIDIEEIDGDEDDEAREVEESIGDLLKNFKKLYNKIKLAEFEPLVVKSTKEWNFLDLHNFEKEVIKRANKDPNKTRAKLDKVIEELKSAKKEWKKDKSVSKGDKKDLGKTLKAAEKFKKQIGKKGLKKRIKAVFKDTRKRMAQRAKTAWKAANKMIDNLAKSASTLTTADYSDFQTKKVPVIKQAFALAFGDDSKEYKSLIKVMIDVDSDEKARTQAQIIVVTARDLTLHAFLKQTGLE
ncbi:hypothetical protein [Candidatus Uabimicrobium sp. HlEnr_7]|uniref:hypothetical protein n=1 Tax=Candidatus Uabimicrobium helgolandensis TaxID=3095367 RepID=UPI0035587C37